MTVKPKETVAANKKQYSLSSALGRTLLTTNAVGTNTSTGTGPLSSFVYDPFGNMVAGGNRPANTTDGSYGFGGNNQKLTETNLALAPIQMGARVYLPGLGRFTSLDPVTSGGANNYVYSLDPINGNDYSGMVNMNLGSNNPLVVGTVSGYTQSTRNPQITAPIQRVQPASGGYQAPSNSYRINTSPARGSSGSAKIGDVPRKNNSTALPVAKMAGTKFPPSSAARNALSPKANQPDYYYNISVSAGAPISFGGGLKRDGDRVQHYVTIGASVKPGIGASTTFSNSEISSGCDVGFSIFYGGVGVSVSFVDWSWEAGFGTPDFSVSASCPID